LNIVKLIKNVKHMKILIKNSLMTKDLKYMITHNDLNVINLSSDDEHGNTDSSISDHYCSNELDIK